MRNTVVMKRKQAKLTKEKNCQKQDRHGYRNNKGVEIENEKNRKELKKSK